MTPCYQYAHSISNDDVIIHFSHFNSKYTYIHCVLIVNMFICPELIEETGRPPSANSWHVGIFGTGSNKLENYFGEKLHTFEGVMT